MEELGRLWRRVLFIGHCLERCRPRAMPHGIRKSLSGKVSLYGHIWIVDKASWTHALLGLSSEQGKSALEYEMNTSIHSEES